MFIKPIRLAFPQSPSDDVDHYRLRVLPHDTDLPAKVADLSYYKDFPYSKFNGEVDDEGIVRVVLDELEVAQGLQGIVDITVTAVDATGHESPPMLIDDAKLDLEAPLPPGQGWLE